MAEEEDKGMTEKEKRKKEVEELLHKYKQRMREEFKTEPKENVLINPVATKEYVDFKKDYMPRHLNLYEKSCNLAEQILKISPDKKKLSDIQEAINICHLSATPSGVASLAILVPILVIVLGSLISYVLVQSTFFIIFFLIIGVSLIPALNKAPFYLANNWRMKTSNQMVLSIFYAVTYMRHTSNIERAIEFASDHIAPPLSLDLKKVLWDVETEKYESVKESLDIYLETWKKWNMEFIESFHLIEGSLYEGSEDRRIALLDNALSVMLEETYEKMMHYSQNLKSPITMLHMLGVILPILGLVILPLVVSFMCEVKWYHLAALYNVALPVGVFFLAKSILSSRPTGYGDTDISEENPEIAKYRNIIFNIGKKEIKLNPLVVSLGFIFLFIFVGLIPLILHSLTSDTKWDLIYDGETVKADFTYDNPEAKYSLLGYKTSKGCPPGEKDVGNIIGPFGLGASILSLLVVAGVGVGTGLYFKLKSQNVIAIREKAKQLEQEFAAALFQLGNRLGDGLPPEIAFGKVAESMQGTVSGDFFNMVSANITRLGMSVEKAIFDPHHGALVYYPSNLIESSMKVLTESAKKGPLIAAQAIINVSRYIKEIHRVNERLKDLMADIISSMKAQISFLSPVISGIVIGITSMITTILGKLGQQIRTISERAGPDATAPGAPGTEGIMSLFGDGVPTFYFQIVVGFYVVQIGYILTIMVNGVENGSDSLNERFLLGKNLIKSTLLYCLVSLFVIVTFNIIASTIVGGIKG